MSRFYDVLTWLSLPLTVGFFVLVWLFEKGDIIV